ncbi:solute:sodium symporter family transporter [Niabella ginsengisoli]|uniref:Solute:sodium symporter family transporter n=1 Tax=Niabella ginsengisoli TaxID=522298 RepID=A0ABS9SLE1_9BACT|nr:solute:sodium symporter family transporter [Niabella ginsengisoli]MCH5599125.1 solute:sodium symporter family transporter [Niabella ginsengisoli]
MFISFFLLLAIAAGISVYTTRKQSKTSVGHYLGNRNLNFWMIGCSLFLTNMSANQFIGENEFVYTTNMSVMCWGMSSILAMIIVSEFLMPVYLKIGAMTTPDFLGIRFDRQTQRMVSIIFLLSYIVNLIPSVLYGCAVAINGIFQLDEKLQISYLTSISILVIFIGVIGCTYSVLGGLKAITINDIVQGIGMVTGGILIIWIGLQYLGQGSVLNGAEKLLNNNKVHLNAIGASNDPIPFGTLFTGMLLINIYYWGMEQYIVQEALGAKNLAESQKGISLACVGKLFAPFLLNIPGLIALQLYPTIENTTAVFPKMINGTLPPIIAGFVAAIVFGGALSTFNAGLNSIGTLFTMNLYKPYLEKRKSLLTIEAW